MLIVTRLLACFLAILIAGCSEGENSLPPSLNSIQITPQIIPQYSTGGAGKATVAVMVDFVPTGSNLKTIQIDFIDGKTLSIPIESTTSGRLGVQFEADTTSLGHYPFNISAIDISGNKSNSLVGAYNVGINDTGDFWKEHTMTSSSGIVPELTRVRTFWADTLWAVGNSIFKSLDGTIWTEDYPANTHRLNDIAVRHNDSLLIAVGDNATILTKGYQDPAGNWAAQTVPALANARLMSVASSEDGYNLVAVGTQLDPVSGKKIGLMLTSPNGTDWNNDPTLVQAEFESIIWGNSMFVAVGKDTSILPPQPVVYTGIQTSSHDVHRLAWTKHAITANGIYGLTDIVFNGSRYIATGDGGVFTSTNAEDWQRIGETIFSGGRAVGHSHWRFMVCGPSVCQFVYCSDVFPATGTCDWNGVGAGTTSPLPFKNISSVSWSHNKWIAAGGTNIIATSP